MKYIPSLIYGIASAVFLGLAFSMGAPKWFGPIIVSIVCAIELQKAMDKLK